MKITPIAHTYPPELEEKLLEIARLDAQLDATVPVTIREAVEDLLRIVNSYYSNKIEGNPTKPSDLLDLNDDSIEQKSKGLLEIKRHIEVQLKLNSKAPVQMILRAGNVKKYGENFKLRRILHDYVTVKK